MLRYCSRVSSGVSVSAAGAAVAATACVCVVRRALSLTMLVKGYGRREHYRVVQHPSDFVTQLWDEKQKLPLCAASCWDLNVRDVAPSVLLDGETLLHKVVVGGSRVLKGDGCISDTVMTTVISWTRLPATTFVLTKHSYNSCVVDLI